ncbi:MAG: hypothetical protein AB7N70_36310, partial [Dehalococcoidia bacterium]
MARVDFAAVKHAALAQLEPLVTQWLPDGRREGHEWVARNPKREDGRLGSFKINLSTGLWGDFATGDKGGDPISLYAWLFDLTQLEAARQLAELLGAGLVETPSTVPVRPAAPAVRDDVPAAAPEPEDADGWRAIVPVPTDAGPPPDSHYRHGKPSRRWTYRDAAGGVLCLVLRFDGKKGRHFGPLTYCERGDERAWRWKALPLPRPLY